MRRAEASANGGEPNFEQELKSIVPLQNPVPAQQPTEAMP